MKKYILAALAGLLLAGCETGPVVTKSSNLAEYVSAAAPIVSASTLRPAITNKPLLTNHSSTASPRSTNNISDSASNYPPITVKKMEPGPGVKIAAVAVSYRNISYYRDEYWNEKSNEYHSIIYRKDLAMGTTKRIRDLNNSCSILQLFADEQGNLYYVARNDDNDGETDLFKYNATNDQLLARFVSEVIRVDNRYIYFHVSSDNDIDTETYAYDLDEFTISRVENASDLAAWNSGASSIVSFEQRNGMYVFGIRDSYTNRTFSCTLSSKDFQIDEINECFYYHGFLIVFDRVHGADSSKIYKINTRSRKVVSVKTISGDIRSSAIAYNDGMIYFYSSSFANDKLVDQKIQSYNIKNSKQVVLKRFKNDDDYEKTYNVEVEAGCLWVCCHSTGDGTFYPNSFSIKLVK